MYNHEHDGRVSIWQKPDAISESSEHGSNITFREWCQRELKAWRGRAEIKTDSKGRIAVWRCA